MNLERINALWDALEFPTEARLAMATKYSQPSTGQWLPDALDAWERTLAAVQARQNLLDEYAEFERAGSDPRRLIRGSSTNRLLEEKTRKVFARKIAASAKAITDLNTYLFKTFGDVESSDSRFASSNHNMFFHVSPLSVVDKSNNGIKF